MWIKQDKPHNTTTIAIIFHSPIKRRARKPRRKHRASRPLKTYCPLYPSFPNKVCNFEQSRHGVWGNTVTSFAFCRAVMG